MERTLTVHLETDIANREFTIEVIDGESGESIAKTVAYSPYEHPEFDEMIGNEIYSWVQMMVEEEEEEK